MAADLRYPIGPFQRPAAFTATDRKQSIDRIAAMPAALRAVVEGLTEAQIDTAYREGGWTVRQVVHHLADSHLNAYVRVKLALTEDDPIVKVWQEAAWAELEDARTLPVETSLRLLESLHERWAVCWRSMPEALFHRTIMHPENGRMTLDLIAAIYAWHGDHHTAHVTSLRKRKRW